MPTASSATMLDAPVLDESMTRSDSIEILDHLQFGRQRDALSPLLVDRHAARYLAFARALLAVCAKGTSSAAAARPA
jgi:hypothetical protein